MSLVTPLILMIFFSLDEFFVEVSFFTIVMNYWWVHFHWKFPFVFNMNFFADKISSMLLLLSVWISNLMLMVEDEFTNKKDLKVLTIILLVILGGSFTTVNMMVFFVMFELSVIPTMMMILGWGSQPERVEANFNLLIYTAFFSLPFLFILVHLNKLNLLPSILLNQLMCFDFPFLSGMIMSLMFMVKIPLFLLHSWLPKAHVEAPLPGSMILAGLLLKLGGYGVMRFCFFTNYIIVYVIFCSVSFIGMVVSCFGCLTFTDVKTVIAYSSVSHMNFMIVGLMLMSYISVSGSYIMMINHGLISSALFYLANVSYKRLNSRSLLIQKSMIIIQPVICFWWFIVCMFNVGLPPTLGCISEIMMTAGIFKMYMEMFLYVFLYLFFSGFYSIYIYYILNHGSSKIFKSFFSLELKEHFIVLMHLLPSMMILLNCDLVSL